jgi:hypothetical protein
MLRRNQPFEKGASEPMRNIVILVAAVLTVTWPAAAQECPPQTVIYQQPPPDPVHLCYDENGAHSVGATRFDAHTNRSYICSPPTASGTGDYPLEWREAGGVTKQ